MSKDIIGINIGSKNTVIGTYKKGVFAIVVSETSARSLPTVVSYNDRERNFAEYPCIQIVQISKEQLYIQIVG